MSINVQHRAGCHNTTDDFASILVEKVSRVSLSLASEFELVVNSMLLAFGCPDCHVLRDDTFGLFVTNHSPSASPASSFGPSQSTATPGTDSLVAEHLAAGRVGTPSESQNFMIGRNASPPSSHASSDNASLGSLAPSENPLPGYSKRNDLVGSNYRTPVPCPSVMGITETRYRRFLKTGGNVSWADEIESTPQDTSMGLGGGKTTEGNGVGDSRHASLDPEEEDGVALVGDRTQSTDYGSMPPLPSTLAETTSEVDMLEGLEEMECGQVVPALGNGLGDSVWAASSPVAIWEASVGPADPNRPIVEQDLMIDRLGAYRRFNEVAMDMHFIKTVLNTMDNSVHALHNHINRLQRRKDAAARTTVNKNVNQTNKKAAVPPPVTPTAPPGTSVVRPTTKNAGPVPTLPRKPPTAPAVQAVRPSDIPLPVTKTLSYVQAATAVSGPQEFTLVQRRRLKSPPPAPLVTVRERHVVVRFDDRGSKVGLPAGVNTEVCKAALNKVLANGSSPARFALCVQHRTSGDLLLTLAQHSAASVWKFVSGIERALMELRLHSFAFGRDTKKIRVLASNLPFAPSGVGTTWQVEDWKGDSAFDDMIQDLEMSNPGFKVVGRPHWVGSLAGHKSHRHMQGSVVFTVELDPGVKEALGRSSVMVYSHRRPLRVWAEIKPTSLCRRCLQHGHVAVMCRAPFACKF
ncbi:unnamed protein product [Tuber aestivum]|uniref:Uncharacterized protein n=1 Tax=Tuber aestivum TaxID=59557 RepID=A0A292PN70_9PEZI|nr:unnamed protein product [Tuber aestivum]